MKLPENLKIFKCDLKRFKKNLASRKIFVRFGILKLNICVCVTEQFVTAFILILYIMLLSYLIFMLCYILFY